MHDGVELGLWCLTSLSTIFQLYGGGQFLLVEETGVPEENQQPVTSHWQTLSHNQKEIIPMFLLVWYAECILTMKVFVSISKVIMYFSNMPDTVFCVNSSLHLNKAIDIESGHLKLFFNCAEQKPELKLKP